MDNDEDRLLLLWPILERKAEGAYFREDQSGDASRDDRHDAFPREPLHEQVPQIGFYRLQWTP
jgi:hypothetical protein